jgi:MFS family permease
MPPQDRRHSTTWTVPNRLGHSRVIGSRKLSIAGKDSFNEQPYGWVIVAVATTCLALGFGANIMVSVFMKPFEQEFGWPRADISMAYSVLTVGAAIGGIVWGGLSDRIGAKWIAIFGVIVLSGGLMALRWQNDLRMLYLLHFLLGALGFACLFTPMVALAGLWFNQNKGLAIGVVTAGGAIGQGVVPFVVRLMITAYGWRDAALWLGIGYFVILMPLLMLLKPPPVIAQSAEQVSQSDENLWGVPHKITVPWLGIAAIFCCVCMAAPLVHLVPLGTDLGFSPQTAAGLLLALMTAGFFGRLFFGWLADRIGGLRAYFCASLAQTSMVFWFTQTSDLLALYAISILFGIGFAGVMTCLLICAREAAPLRITGFAMALVSTTAWIGMGVGGYQAGYFYDLSGNYVVAYGNAAIAGIVNLAIVGLLIWYRRRFIARLEFA